jgi:uncharacterized protein (TIGR04255 family)
VNFRPHQDANAIVLVSFVCEFAHPLGEERLRAFANAHNQFKDEFPGLNTAQGVSVQLGTGGAPVSVPGLAAVAFQDFGRDGGLRRAFQAQQQAIAFVHNQYTHWSEIWPQVRQTFAAGLAIVPHAQVQAFGLEYVDRFTSSLATRQPDVTGLFKRGSQYLVPRVFDVSGVWHSHHGSLEEGINHPHPHSKNDNINVALVREQPSGEFAVNMVLRHRRILAQTVLASAAISYLDSFMDDMHSADKMIVRGLLTEEAARAIQLETDDAGN